MPMLEKVPAGLAGIYSYALGRVLERSDDQIRASRKIFQWVFSARRPLTIDELHDALTIEPGQQSWKQPSHRYGPSTVSKLCGNLVIFDEVDGTLTLAHHTVRGFFESSSRAPKVDSFCAGIVSADSYLAKMCVTYLGFTDFQKVLTTIPDGKDLHQLSQPLLLAVHGLPGLSASRLLGIRQLSKPFRRDAPRQKFDIDKQLRYHSSRKPGLSSSFRLLDYCASNWFEHLRFMPFRADETVEEGILKLLRQPSLPFSWQPWGLPDDLDPYQYWHVFIWAVSQGHTPILEVWKSIVRMDEEIGSWTRFWDTSGNQILALACATRNHIQLNMLLHHNSSAVIKNEAFQKNLDFALIIAAALGKGDVVETLIQGGASALAEVNNLPNEMSNLRFKQYGPMGTLLLQSFGTSDKWRYPRTALQAASSNGHLHIVKRLLELKADVNATSYNSYMGRTALQAAAEIGHLEIVARLLEEKADVNAAPSEHSGRTALQAAAEKGHLAIVTRLVEEKAEVNAAPCKHFGITALQGAAEFDHTDIVRKLLRRGADINFTRKGVVVATALHIAARNGNFAIVHLLIESGANIDIKGKDGTTALMLAETYANEDVIKALRDAGVKRRARR